MIKGFKFDDDEITLSAENAANDGNSANIDETYAKIEDLSAISADLEETIYDETIQRENDVSSLSSVIDTKLDTEIFEEVSGDFMLASELGYTDDNTAISSYSGFPFVGANSDISAILPIRIDKNDGAITNNGSGCVVIGTNAWAEGSATSAVAPFSHAGGCNIVANGEGSFAQGIAMSGRIECQTPGSFAQGYALSGTIATYCNQGDGGAVAQGYVENQGMIASYNKGSIAQGYASSGNINAYDFGSFAQGFAKDDGKIKSSGNGAVAIGAAYKDEESVIAEGNGTVAMGIGSKAIGVGGAATFALGRLTYASGIACFAENAETSAIGDCAHAEGCGTLASGSFSHAAGYHVKACGNGSFAQGFASGGTIESNSSGSFIHGYAVSNGSLEINSNSIRGFTILGYAETSGKINGGERNYGDLICGGVSNNGIISGGFENDGTLIGGKADTSGIIVAVGCDGGIVFGKTSNKGLISAYNDGAFAHGFAAGYSADLGTVASIIASGYGAFANGFAQNVNNTIIASGDGAVAMGAGTSALNNESVALGLGTCTKTSAGMAIGKFNNLDNANSSIFQVGIGTDKHRKDAFYITTAGTTYIMSGSTLIDLSANIGKVDGNFISAADPSTVSAIKKVTSLPSSPEAGVLYII